MMLKTGFEAAMENALNAYLSADPETASGLESIVGCRVAITIKGTDVHWVFQVDDGGRLSVLSDTVDPPEASVCVSPLALLLLGREDRPPSVEDLSIEGDAEVVERLWSVLRQVELDWEEWLSRWLGDIAAHFLAERIRGLGAREKRVRTHIMEDLGEFLTEESRVIPPRLELDAFLDAVDQLREGIDRLDARLARLESRAPDKRA